MARVNGQCSITAYADHDVNIYSYKTTMHHDHDGTSRICPSWPRSEHRLSPILASPCEHVSCCPLFMTTVLVSPQRLLLSGWLITNVQVNITTALYDTAHMYIHHTSTTIYVLLYTSSILLGRVALLHSLCPLQLYRKRHFFKLWAVFPANWF